MGDSDRNYSFCAKFFFDPNNIEGSENSKIHVALHNEDVERLQPHLSSIFLSDDSLDDEEMLKNSYQQSSKKIMERKNKIWVSLMNSYL